MTLSSSIRGAIGSCIAVTLLAGCGGSSTGFGAPRTATQSALRPIASAALSARPVDAALSGTPARIGSVRRGTGASWMSPEAKTGDLLYVSDYGAGVVDVLSYPRGKQVGMLSGFNAPHGSCVDKAGNVWITNELGSEILEYAHGGTTPIATLSDPNEYPTDCSVDPLSGNLAVSNTQTPTQGPGSVAIYRHAQGTPQLISDTAMPHVFYLGYDGSGNLFVDGENANVNEFQFAELPKGKHVLTNIVLNQTIGFAGGVKWDGRYVAVGDQSAAIVYQTNGAGGKVEGSTPLTGSSEVVDFWLQAPRLIGADLGNANVGVWKYPAGGSATKDIKGFSEPIGVSVSPG